MPIYDYKCTECGTIYDIFHKVREVKEDIVCPSCKSNSHTRLISAPNISMNAQKASTPPCGDASCCGGQCSLT